MQWHLENERLQECKSIAYDLNDRDLGMVRSMNLRCLFEEKYVNSEVLDASFSLFESLFKGVISLSFLFMKKKEMRQKPTTLRNKLKMDTGVIVIPIHFGAHWYAGLILLTQKCILIMESFYKRPKTEVFTKMLEVANAATKLQNTNFEQNEWKLIQPHRISKQRDGINCAIYAFLNTFYVLKSGHDYDDEKNNLNSVRNWIACQLCQNNMPEIATKSTSRDYIDVEVEAAVESLILDMMTLGRS